MLRLRVRELLEERGWTVYRLAKEAGITFNQAYRIARRDGRFSRLERVMIEKVCQALGVEPGALFERERPRRQRTRR